MVSLRFFFKKTSVQKHYTEIVKNGIAFMLSLTRTHSLCETENLLPIISDTFFTSEKIFAFTQLQSIINLIGIFDFRLDFLMAA